MCELCRQNKLSSAMFDARRVMSAMLFSTTLGVSYAQAADTASSEVKLEEVIVTASRHAEDVQKESRAIDVLSGDYLANQGSVGVQALNAAVPGVQVGVSLGQVQIYVRGIGDRSVNSQTSPGVSLSYDGVFLPRGWESGALFFDMQRVEVLKGPQGTLYGRNATAGAANMIPKTPAPEFGGDFALQGTNYNGRTVTGAVNAPLSNTVAVRAAMQINKHDGYLSDGSNDADSQAARLQFLFTPNEALSVRWNSAYSYSGGAGDEWVMVDPANPKSNHWLAQANDPASQALITSPPGYVGFSTHGYMRIKTWIHLANVEWKLPGMTLTVLPAYVDGDMSYLDFPSVSVHDETTSKQSSLEVRLASSDTGTPLIPGLQWVVGVYGSNENLKEEFISNQGAFGVSNSHFDKLNDKSWAVFAEGKYSILDTLRVIGGARYTSEKKVAQGFVDPLSAGPGSGPGPLSGSFDNSKSFTKFNYRAGVEYDVAPKSMAYLTYSTGFKAGGFFASPEPNSYEPENLSAYELGIKNRFFDDRLQLNVELFNWTYRNLQQQVFDILPIGVPSIVTRNAGKATLRGVDIDLQAAITSQDVASLQVEYNHNKNDDFQYDSIQLGQTTCTTSSAAPPLTHFNCSGKELVKAPKWSGTAGYEHTFVFANDSSLTFRAEERFSSRYWLANDYIDAEHAPSFAITNLRLTYTLSNPGFSVSAFINNLENKPIYTSGVQSPKTPGIAELTIDAPRVYGMRMSYSF